MSPVAPTTRPDKKRSRTPAIVALSIAIFLLFAVIFSQATFNLTFLQPDTSEETLIFAALSALIFLLFVALTFVLLRTLLRLYAERKTGVMGSKLRSRMVMGALLMSLGPVILLFLFSYGLINRSIEKWFSRPVEDVQYRTGVVASLLTDYAADNARVEAERIAATPAAKKSFETDNFTLVMDEFRRSEVSLQGGFAFAVADGNAEASFHAPQPWPLIRDSLPMKEAAENKPKAFDHSGKDLRAGPCRSGARMARFWSPCRCRQTTPRRFATSSRPSSNTTSCASSGGVCVAPISATSCCSPWACCSRRRGWRCTCRRW